MTIHARPVSHTLIDPQDLLGFIDNLTGEDPLGVLYRHLVELRDRPYTEAAEAEWQRLRDQGYEEPELRLLSGDR